MKGTKPQLRMTKGAVADALPAPPWLSAHAATEWERVMPLLVDRRILTEADLGSLENYCVAQGRVRQLEAILAQDFEVKTFRAQNQAMATARLFAAELGLTPVSRSRPAIREDEEEDGDASPLDVS